MIQPMDQPHEFDMLALKQKKQDNFGRSVLNALEENCITFISPEKRRRLKVRKNDVLDQQF